MPLVHNSDAGNGITDLGKEGHLSLHFPITLLNPKSPQSEEPRPACAVQWKQNKLPWDFISEQQTWPEMFKNINRNAQRKHVRMPQDILFDVMKFEVTAGDSEPDPGIPVSVHRSIISNDRQQDATLQVYLFLVSFTCFGRCFRPSSGARDFIYSFC